MRRNIYEAGGKEITPAKTEANGDADGGVDKSLEESLKRDTKQYFCNSCGKDCTRVRYHCSKAPPSSAPGKTGAMAKHDVCPICYQEGKIPGSLVNEDYTKLENEKYNSIADRDSPWSDSELLLLLEGLELFDENWSSVAEHVGTRTREECVLKFLQLEIEDKYLEGEREVDGPSNLAYLSNGRIPYSQADNPVMSVMGFLAGLADPAVAAAAAGKTADEMKKHIRGKLEKESTAGAEDAPERESTSAAVKDEGRMDVDVPSTALQTTSGPDSTSPATLALSLTAARSAALASHTERHLTSLVSSAVNLQLQKMELKLQQFAEMETLLAAERRELERQRQRLFLDRLAFKKRVRDTEEKFRRLGVNGDSTKGEDGDERLSVKPASTNGLDGEVKPLSEGDTGYKMHEI